jgi:UDP-glucuronate decarboxylase
MMQDRKAHALVTGGAGFLGSHVCARLHAEGFEVTCLDNLRTGRRSNLASLLGKPGFHLIEGDVRNALPDIAFDEIWNMASPASPPRYQSDPVATLLTNVVGTHHVLDLAHRHGSRLLQASTSEVYGDPQVHPQPEDYRGFVNPIGPRACYDEGKRAAEALCFDYRRLHGVEVRVARIFNTYGPHMDPADGRVVSNFIAKALAGQPLELYGTGAQTRSFCYVEDLIEGLFRLMRYAGSVETPVNLGSSDEFTIRTLADLVLELTGSASPLVDRPLPEDDPAQRRPDISLAGRLLGWSPRVGLREGLMHSITACRAETQTGRAE